MHHSQNGDGKNCALTNRFTSPTPAEEREDQIIAALAGRYDQLDGLWQHAEEDLRRFRLHTPVMTAPFKSNPLFASDYDERGPRAYYMLGFLRCGKHWRICYGVQHDPVNGPDEEPHWTPISDCSVEMRIEAIPVFEELRKKVVETAEQTVPKLDKALANFRQILELF